MWFSAVPGGLDETEDNFLPTTIWNMFSPACLSKESICTTGGSCQIPCSAMGSYGQPWQARKTMQKEMHTWKADPASKDQFCKKYMKVISREVLRFLDRIPLLGPLYAQRDIFSKFIQPTCLDSRHAGRTRSSKIVSLGGLRIRRGPILRPPWIVFHHLWVI